MRHSNPQRERACAFIFLGWTQGAWRLSSKSSPKPTPSIICLLCSMAPQATARRRSSIRIGISLLELPAYSPELDPVERWFQEFRRELSNRTFEAVELLQEALSQTLRPYWEDPARLRQLTGFSWWVEAIDAL